MTEIGVFDAKTHLPRLLRRVEQGERFVVTRHSRPIAELIPYRGPDADKVAQAIVRLREFRECHSLKGLSVAQMIKEGRRY